MFRWAFKRFAKQLDREAKKSPKKKAMGQLPFLARRHFSGYDNDQDLGAAIAQQMDGLIHGRIEEVAAMVVSTDLGYRCHFAQVVVHAA